MSTTKRSRKPTEKGQAYEDEQRWKACITQQKSITKKINKINTIVGQGIPQRELNDFLDQIDKLAEELTIRFNSWRDIIKDDIRLYEGDAWLKEQKDRIVTFKDKIKDQPAATKSPQHKSSKASKSSKYSSSSSEASSYSTLKASSRQYLKHKARTAALLAKAQFIEEKQRLRNEVEKLELQEQIKIAQAKENTFNTNEEELLEESSDNDTVKSAPQEDEETDTKHDCISMEVDQSLEYQSENKGARYLENKEELQPKPRAKLPIHSQLTPPDAFKYSLNPFATEFRPPSSDLRDILQLLTTQQQQLTVPPLKIANFTGDPTEFHTFISSFTTQIENKVQDRGVCLRYLQQFVEGPPNELIKGCLYDEVNRGYYNAKKLLTEKYGDPYVISNAYLKKVAEWPDIKQGDIVALERLANVSHAVSQCHVVSFVPVGIGSSAQYPDSGSKLPFALQERWRRQAFKLRRSSCESIPGFRELSDFIQTETKVAMDPVFSREVLSKVHTLNISKTTAS